MTANRWRLLISCLLATFLISGVVGTLGLVVPDAAARFGVTAPEMATTFGWFTYGVFSGNVISFWLFDRLPIRLGLLGGYLVCALSLFGIHALGGATLLPAVLALFGLAIAITICAAGTLITRLWDGRQRQTALVAQDAMFNGGGLLFSQLATAIIVRGLGFSWLYVALAVLAIGACLLTFLSDFDSEETVVEQDDQALVTEWNLPFIIVGFSLLLFMMAKIMLFIWAPQLVEERFATVGAGGAFMSNIFAAAFVGSLAGTWLASRIAVRIIVYSLVLLSAASVWALTQIDSAALLMPLAFAYGFSVSATFNAYCAHALSLVAVPTHRNIAFLLFMSGLGSAFAPAVSSYAVTHWDRIEAGVQCSLVTLALVIVLLVLSALANRLRGGAAIPQQTF